MRDEKTKMGLVISFGFRRLCWSVKGFIVFLVGESITFMLLDCNFMIGSINYEFSVNCGLVTCI